MRRRKIHNSVVGFKRHNGKAQRGHRPAKFLTLPAHFGEIHSHACREARARYIFPCDIFRTQTRFYFIAGIGP